MDDRRTMLSFSKRAKGENVDFSDEKERWEWKGRARDQQIVKLLTAKVIRVTMPADIRLCVASSAVKDSLRDSRHENEIFLRREGALVRPYILLVFRSELIFSLEQWM